MLLRTNYRGTATLLHDNDTTGHPHPHQFKLYGKIANQWRAFKDMQPSWSQIEAIIDYWAADDDETHPRLYANEWEDFLAASRKPSNIRCRLPPAAEDKGQAAARNTICSVAVGCMVMLRAFLWWHGRAGCEPRSGCSASRQREHINILPRLQWNSPEEPVRAPYLT
eukprot:COSAG06_NODE_109_length_23526_cov_4.928843_8_plen_167_part_00